MFFWFLNSILESPRIQISTDSLEDMTSYLMVILHISLIINFSLSATTHQSNAVVYMIWLSGGAHCTQDHTTTFEFKSFYASHSFLELVFNPPNFCSTSVIKSTTVTSHFILFIFVKGFYYGSEKNIVTPKSSLYRSQVFGLCGLSSSSLGRNSL